MAVGQSTQRRSLKKSHGYDLYTDLLRASGTDVQNVTIIDPQQQPQAMDDSYYFTVKGRDRRGSHELKTRSSKVTKEKKRLPAHVKQNSCDGDSLIDQLLNSVSKSECWREKGKNTKHSQKSKSKSSKGSKKSKSKSSKGSHIGTKGEHKSKSSSQKGSKPSKKSKSKQPLKDSKSKKVKSSKGSQPSVSSLPTIVSAPQPQQIPTPAALPSSKQPIQQNPSPVAGPSTLQPDETEPPVSGPQTGSQTSSPQIVSPITSSPVSGPQAQQPTVSPMLAETIAPILTTTSAPTLLPPDGNQRSASPFNLIYNGITGDPTTADFDAAAEVTLRYLEEFFTSQFALSQLTNVDVFDGTVGAPDIAGLAVPLEVTIQFSEDSMFIPGRSDLDTWVFVAFQEPWVSDLLPRLAMDLPSSNPLSATMSVTYQRNRR